MGQQLPRIARTSSDPVSVRKKPVWTRPRGCCWRLIVTAVKPVHTMVHANTRTAKITMQILKDVRRKSKVFPVVFSDGSNYGLKKMLTFNFFASIQYHYSIISTI
jgi:hypothetical protein